MFLLVSCLLYFITILIVILIASASWNGLAAGFYIMRMRGVALSICLSRFAMCVSVWEGYNKMMSSYAILLYRNKYRCYSRSSKDIQTKRRLTFSYDKEIPLDTRRSTISTSERSSQLIVQTNCYRNAVIKSISLHLWFRAQLALFEFESR